MSYRPKGETTHYIFASLRSGGRRLAARTAMEHPIGALPRTPFPASWDFAPVGSMSLDSRVAWLPYESSSFATSRGNEKIGGTGYCVTYDTESQSRNADFISIAAERQSATLGAKGPVKPKNPWAEGPSILRTLPHNADFIVSVMRGLSISLFHRASPGCRPCLLRLYSLVRPVSWLLFCCGRRSGSRR